MKKNYLLLSMLAGILVISSCRRDFIYGDITPNTDRVIVEFVDAKNAKSVAMNYATGVITVDVADIQFMLRSVVKGSATVKVIGDPTVVTAYNTANGTTYNAVPGGLFALKAGDIQLTETDRKQKVSIMINPANVATGEWAIGLKISSTTLGEVSQIADKVVIILSVKNKYDGVYHMKGYYTRTDAVGAPYNGPFDTEVFMITTGPTSVAMYSDEVGGFTQPFYDYGGGQITGFGNVGPEVSFNATTDQASGIANYTGTPPMTLYPGANSRFVGGGTPVIYLKYYYNPDPTNRIFADTLIYTGPR